MVPGNKKEVKDAAKNNVNEKKKVEVKKEQGEDFREPVRCHFSTKAEALEYLSDLSNNPSLANWFTAIAREEAARRLRRTGRKKNDRTEAESNVVKSGDGSIGSIEAMTSENGAVQRGEAEGAQGSDHLGTGAVLESEAGLKQQEVNDTGEGDIQSASNSSERTEPTGHSNVLEVPASVVDLCSSSAEEVKVIENTSQEAVIYIMEKGEQAENDADLETAASLQEQPADRKYIVPEKLLRKQAEDAYSEGTVLLEAEPESADRKDITPEKVLVSGRTEPTGSGNILEESASLIVLCCSSAEEVKAIVDSSSQDALMNAKEECVIGTMEKGKQAENDAGLETKASLEAEPANQKNIIPVKLLMEQAERNADLERRVPLKALSAGGKDIIQKKRAPRYFEPQESSQQKCNNSGEDDDGASDLSDKKKKKKKKKQKICCICGRVGHKRKRCHKVTKCLFCNQKGHLAKDCPEENIVQEQTSNFCLKCGNSGHAVSSCPNDYPADDLMKIQCYVCKAFGHLCCVDHGNEGPRTGSCYNCGETGHHGSECKLPVSSTKPRRRMSRNKRRRLRKASNESESACTKNGNLPAEEMRGSKAGRTPKPKPKNYVQWFQPPYRYGSGPQSYIPRNYVPPHRFGFGPPANNLRNTEMINGQQSRPWRGFHYSQQQKPFFGAYRSNVWVSPAAAAAEGNNVSSSNSAAAAAAAEGTQL